jgi:hypothetical protein
MTMIVSCATKDFITITADRAVTESNGSSARFVSGTKVGVLPNAGLIAHWGERYLSDIFRWFHLPPDLADIDEALNLVDAYIKKVAAEQHESPTGEMGFHVAGFDSEGQPHLHHICWSVPLPNAGNGMPTCQNNDHSPTPEMPIQLLYNGRNDIAQLVIDLLLSEMRNGNSGRFNLKTPNDLVHLGDFIARFASELTKEVGLPLTTYLLAPDNHFEVIHNRVGRALGRKRVDRTVKRLLGQAISSESTHASAAREAKIMWSIVTPGVQTDSSTGLQYNPGQLIGAIGRSATMIYWDPCESVGEDFST